MKDDNCVKMEFPSRSANEGFARAAVASFAARLDPTMDEISDIKTAVSEAVTNCIVHAYPDCVGTVFLRVRVLGSDVLQITVRDRGRGIENVDAARQPLFTTGGEERSGMGFTIMESFMDKVRIRSRVGHGTTVTMTRHVKGRDSV